MSQLRETVTTHPDGSATITFVLTRKQKLFWEQAKRMSPYANADWASFIVSILQTVPRRQKPVIKLISQLH